MAEAAAGYVPRGRPPVGGHPVLIACLLALACLALLLTAPAAGDFWWQDAPRHAINGVFVRDFVAAQPVIHPSQWAIDYYLMRPALTIMFYPPLFYAVEAGAFALFGVSHFVAQAVVSCSSCCLPGRCTSWRARFCHAGRPPGPP